MTDKKKHKYDGDTFEKIIRESMHKGSGSHFASKMIEDFSDEQREATLTKVKGLSSIVDRLKLLLEKVEEEKLKEEPDVQEDE